MQDFEHLIVVEGEFNQLQLQSLLVRYGEATGQPLQFLYCVSVGGVNNADYSAIRRLSTSPIFWCDSDEEGQGEYLAKNALEFMSCDMVTTPECSDADEFIRQFPDPVEGWQRLGEFMASRDHCYRSYKGARAEVFQARNETLREFRKSQKVKRIILDDLRERGEFYNDRCLPYVFLKDRKKLIEIDFDADNKNLKALLDRYGINASEPLYRYMVEAIWIYALEEGTYTQVHRLSHYRRRTNTVYLNNFNDQIYRITPDQVDLVDNGTDGVLFLGGRDTQPFLIQYQDYERHKDGLTGSPFHDIIISKINYARDFLRENERRILFLIWFLGMFFKELFPTKPILVFLGEKGSGKSITIRKVGILLFGGRFNLMPLPNDPRDFDAAVAHTCFLAIDNADSRCRWLPDRLATVATGGSQRRRKYYTTNSLEDYPVNCFLAITSRSPHFRRDDNADRSLIMKVDRYKSFIGEQLLLDEVIDNRDLLMTEVIGQLQGVVQALCNEKDNDYSGTFRMADFGDFAIKVARAAGIEEDLKQIFERLAKEQSSFTLEGPVFDLLWLWTGKPGNSGRPVENTTLCAELTALGQEEGVHFPYEGNPRGFAQKMSHWRSNLSEFFTIKKYSLPANKAAYSYERRSEA